MQADTHAALSRSILNPLFRVSALSGVVQAIEHHLARGDDVNAADLNGRTPLILAASRGHLVACMTLVEAGAAIDLLDNRGLNARASALECGHSEVAAWLGELGDNGAPSSDLARAGAARVFAPEPLVREGPPQLVMSELAISRAAGPEQPEHVTAAEAVSRQQAEEGERASAVPGVTGSHVIAADDRQSQLKLLIARGKEQGYVTYAQLYDLLPPEIVDPKQIEAIVNTINDMGISVYENPPELLAILAADFVGAEDDGDLSDEQPAGDILSSPAFDQFTQGSLLEALHAVLKLLTPMEAKVVRMVFGVDGERRHTLEETAKHCGISHARALKLQSAAIRKLRHPCRSEQLRTFLVAMAKDSTDVVVTDDT